MIGDRSAAALLAIWRKGDSCSPMPPLYILIHLLLAALAARLVFVLPERSRIRIGAGVVALLVVTGGLLVERRPAWSWPVLALGWPDAIFMAKDIQSFWDGRALQLIPARS